MKLYWDYWSIVVVHKAESPVWAVASLVSLRQDSKEILVKSEHCLDRIRSMTNDDIPLDSRLSLERARSATFICLSFGQAFQMCYIRNDKVHRGISKA